MRRLFGWSSAWLVVFLQGVLLAQSVKVLAPHKPVAPPVSATHRKPLPPAKAGSMVGGLWMTDANFKSSIYLRNLVETSAVTVTPVLHLSNGTQYILPDVKLDPAATSVVDINAALQSLGIAPYATLSGYIEVRYIWPWDPVCVTVRDVDVTHSLIFTYGLGPSTSALSPATQTSQVLDGLWWKQEPGVTGFVALANTSSAKRTATVQVTDQKGVSLATHSVTVSPHGTKTLQLSELEYATGSSGGIHITYNGGAGDLLVFGGLEDQNSGYSAGLGFRAPPAAAAKPAEMSYAALGLMAGAADPMMNFPAGTTFAPYSVLRNISDAPATATPTLWWMAGGTAHSYQLPALTLFPGESTRLDVPALITAAGLSNFNGNLNLAVDVKGKPGALLQVAGSVDHSNSYVFEVSPRGIVESASKSLAYWSTANGDDTMMTLWNPADEAQDFVFKVTFTGGHYSLPIHLGPRATRTLNLSEVIQNQIPDAEGNVIPLSIHEGSGKIAGAHADNEHILLAADVGIYNVKKATCGLVCFTCDGADTASITPSPFSVGVDDTQQMDFTVTWDTGQQYDLTSQSSWGSSNGTGSVSVNNSGLVTGQTAGTTNVGASDNSEPVYSTVCVPLPADNPCPVDFGAGASASGTVYDATPVIQGVSPNSWNAGATQPVTFSGQNFGTNAPTLTFSDSTITYSLVPNEYNDTKIVANITVPSGTPTENVTVSVTSNGFSGSGFQSGGSGSTPKSQPAQATVKGITGSLVVNFTGNRNSADKLVFIGSQSCSNSLGLIACTGSPSGYWLWNVEAMLTVSNDVSQWTFSQTVQSGRFKGNYAVTTKGVKTLQAFNFSEGTSSDNPASTNTQQTSGSSVGFYIDYPGIMIVPTTPSNATVDSGTFAYNFASQACSKANSSICANYQWYVKIVIDAGGHLDTAKSAAGSGSVSTNF